MFGTAIRNLAKKPKPKMGPTVLKTPPEQRQTITRVLFDIVKEHGPITVSNTWERVKVATTQPFPSILQYMNESICFFLSSSLFNQVVTPYRLRCLFDTKCLSYKSYK